MVSGALYNGIIPSAIMPSGTSEEQLRALDAVAENGAAKEQGMRGKKQELT